MIIAISTGFGIQNEIKNKFSNVFGDLSIDRYDNDLYNSENYIESDAIKVNTPASICFLNGGNHISLNCLF